MPVKAGQIVINLTLGQAQFMERLVSAKAGIKDFGASGSSSLKQVAGGFGEMGSRGVSSVQATSGALRELEGNFGNNIRAVERFLATTLGLGPVLQKIFPLVGGIAFGGMVVELGEKTYKFFKDMQEAPARMQAAFRGFQGPLTLANDELDLANARLQSSIDKLEGKTENTLAATLAEAKVQADKLGDSLERDIASVNKLLKEQELSLAQQAFSGNNNVVTSALEKTLGGETGFGGVAARVQQIRDDEAKQLEALKTPARLEREPSAIPGYQRQIHLTGESADSYTPGQIHVGDLGMPLPAKGADSIRHAADAAIAKIYQNIADGITGVLARPDLPQADQERLRMARTYALSEVHNVQASDKNADLTARATRDKGNLSEAGDPSHPFENRMAALGVQIDAVKAKLAAIGQSEAAQVMAKAFGEAQKAIEETNKALERQGASLTEQGMQKIRDKELTLATVEAEAEWKTKLAASTTSIADRIRSTDLLTAAIGKGYEATKLANIETRVMQELGQHYDDAAWRAKPENQKDVATLRSGYGREFDAQHAQQTSESLQKLKEEIELERELALVQRLGAEVVRQRAFEVKAAQMAAMGATKEQIQAEKELFDAQRANASAADFAKIEQRIAATQRLTTAILGGAEAERQAALENKYAEMQRAGALPAEIDATRHADELDHAREITAEALKLGMAHQNDLEHVNQEISAMEALRDSEEKIRVEKGDSLEIDKAMVAIEISLRDLEKERLRIMAQQSLAMGSAKDGLRAYFLEMQAESKTAAQFVYDSLKQATTDGEGLVSKNIADMITGQYKKGDWGKSLQQMGNQMVQSSIKDLLQQGVSSVASLLGLDVNLGGGGKPDGSMGKPYWVRIAGGGGQGGSDDGGGYWTVSGSGSDEAPESHGLGGILGLSRTEGQDEGSGEGSGSWNTGSGEAPEVQGLDGILGISKREGSDEGSGEGSDYDNTPGVTVPKGLWRRTWPEVVEKFIGSFAGMPSMGGDGAAAGTPNVTSSISYGGAMAGGGPVLPGYSYTVRDGGDELFLPGKAGNIVPLSKMGGKGGDVHIHNHIDARGAELGAANRMARALENVHRSAVATAIHAMDERDKRRVK